MKVEYNQGRFFVSPVIGCMANCIYCYIDTRINNKKIKVNEMHIEQIIDSIITNEHFKYGRNGSIISVGAWGDIFPLKNQGAKKNSVDWIIEILKLGNPVQIMSKFTVEKELTDEICTHIQYEGQLLYSSTITTFDRWKSVEPNASSPIERLETISYFAKKNVPTNVMIKPFIPGITNIEVNSFQNYLKEYKVDYCVVGILYWTNDILNKLSKLQLTTEITKLSMNQIPQTLDCSGDIKLDALTSTYLDSFVAELRNAGINTFKKSCCVNSNILNIKNVSEYYLDNTYGFCINCGNC